MMKPLLLFAVIVLSVSALLSFLLAITFLVRPDNKISLTERLQFQKLSRVTIFGVVACIVGMLVAYEISTGIFIALVVDLALMAIQIIIYRFK